MTCSSSGRTERSSARSETKVSHVQTIAGGVRFKMIDRLLPLPTPGPPSARPEAAFVPDAPWRSKIRPRKVRAEDRRHDRDDRRRRRLERRSQAAEHGPELDQVEALRAAINRKNDLFFYRWRPQNITYLLGFRKHEQGNNAVEIAAVRPAGRRAGKVDRAAQEADAARL